MNRKLWLCIVILSVWLSDNGLFAQEDPGTDTFDFIKSHLQESVRLEIIDQQLEFKHPESREDAQSLFSPLVEKLRSGGSGMAGANWDVRAGHDNHSEYVVLLTNGFQLGRTPVPGLREFSIVANREGSPHIQFQQFQNFVCCTANQPSKNRSLFLFGSVDKELTAVVIDQGKVQSFAINLFRINSYENLKATEKLGELLAELGLANNLASFSSAMRVETLSLITAEPGSNKEFDQFLDRLEADSFEERESAAKELSDSFTKWEQNIIAWLKAPDRGPETRARLAQLVDKNKSRVHAIASAAIRTQKLDQDAKWIVDVWAASKSSQAQDAKLIAYLQTLTNQNELKSKSEWIKFAEKLVEPHLQIGTPAPVNTDATKLKFFAQQISRLCALTENKAGHLKIDREFWSSQFDGAKPIEIRDRIRKFAKEQGAPISLVTPSNNWTGVGPQHLIFLNLSDRADDAQYSNKQHGYAGPGGLIRKRCEIQTRHLDAHLKMPRISGRNPLDAEELENIDIAIQTGGPFGCNMEIVESKNQLRLVLAKPGAAEVCLVVQTSTTFDVIEIRGQELVHVSASSFKEFREKYPDYFEKSLRETLKSFCIRLDVGDGQLQTFDSAPLAEIQMTK